MNTQLLKYALEVEKAGSISQAADNLYMGQPNLSKAIKELEDTLGIMIFKRTSKGVIPTQQGAEVLKYAKNILAQIEKLKDLYKNDNQSVQTFSISIPRGSYISKAVTNFIALLDQDKDIEVNIKETNSMGAINNIIDGLFNLGIIRYPLSYEKYFLDFCSDKGIKHEMIWEFENLVALSKKHPLANVKEITVDDLEKYIEITHGDECVPYLNIEGANLQSKFNTSKKVIYVYERCSQFDMLTNIPTTYMWVSPIPQEFLNRYNLVQRKCSTQHKFKDVLIYPEDYTFTHIDMMFLDKLYESKNDLAFKKYR